MSVGAITAFNSANEFSSDVCGFISFVVTVLAVVRRVGCRFDRGDFHSQQLGVSERKFKATRDGAIEIIAADRHISGKEDLSRLGDDGAKLTNQYRQSSW